MFGWPARLIGCCVALAGLLAAGGETAAADSDLRPVGLQLKWTHQFQFAGYYAAIEKGYFRDAGLDVTLIEGGPEIDPAAVVVDGAAAFGVGNSSLVIDRSRGRPVVVVAGIFQHSPFVILTRREPGLESVHDLVGRTLMVETHSAELLAYLRLEGVPLDRLNIVPHTGDPLVLRDGEVAALTAYTTTEPFDLIQERIPYRMFDPRAAGIDYYGDTLFTRTSLAETEPDLVRAFREASLEGWRYALANADEVIDVILADYAPDLDRRKLEYEAEEIRRLMIADVIDIGYVSRTRWRHIAGDFADAGLMPDDFLLDGFIFDLREPASNRWLYIWMAGSVTVLLAVSVVAHRFYRLSRKLKAEIAARRRLEEELTRLAATDPLTGVANRRRLMERAEEEFRRARRLGEPLAVLQVDLDHFKLINDSWGPATGDRALKAVAAALVGSIRDMDVVGRLGGEEFALLLPAIPPAAAHEVAERVRQTIERLEFLSDGGQPIALTASVGVASVIESDRSVDDLFARADEAMYAAKRAGRNRMVAWQAA